MHDQQRRFFERLKLAQAPDKTFIGRIERGFDFLGYQFTPKAALALAAKTLQRHAARWLALDEQQKRKTAPEGAAVLEAYVRRWQRWCQAGLGGLLPECFALAAAMHRSKHGEPNSS